MGDDEYIVILIWRDDYRYKRFVHSKSTCYWNESSYI